MKHLNSNEWYKSNIAEIKKRTVDIDEVGVGNIMIITGNNDEQQVDLVKKEDIKFRVITSEIIDFKKLKKASSLERRLNIVLNSVRNFTEYFYFENRLSKMIIYGSSIEEDEEENI